MPPHRPARWLVAALISAAILGLLAYQARDTAESAGRRVGVVIHQAGGGLTVRGVLPDGPADAAGLEPGDGVVRIGATATAKASDWDRAAAGFRAGEPVEVEVLRDGRRRVLRMVPGMPFPWARVGVNALAALAYLALALLVVLQARRGVAHRLLLVFSVAVALELTLPATSIGHFGLLASALTVYYLLTGLEIGVELHLASVIPERPRWLATRPWMVPVYYAVGLALAAATAATFLAEDVAGRDLFPWSSAGIEQLLLRFAMPVWALAVAAILAVPAFTHPKPRGRQQAALVLAGVVPWALFVLVLAVVGEEAFVGLAWLAVLEPLVLLCYPVAVFVAIFRYHLFDIQVPVRRSILYGAATGAIFLVFFSALGAGGAIFSHLFEHGGSVWAIATATLVLGLLLGPLIRVLQRWIDRRLFPERHALRAHLVALAAELPALGKVPRMGDHLVERICGIFGARSALLLLADPTADRLGVVAVRQPPGGDGVDRAVLFALSDPAVGALERASRPVSLAHLEDVVAEPTPLLARLHELGASLVAPLPGNRRLVGLLALGPRREGERYRGEEVELLDLLCRHAAMVFENARLFESATYESLTGLLRREVVLDRLASELERAQRYSRPLTVGMADLDHFKRVNDRHGHLAGDSLLRRIAETLKDCLRTADVVGRYGGEEFLLILPETDLAGAQAAAEKMRAAVERTSLPLDSGIAGTAPEETSVTVSIGLASLDELTVEGYRHVTAQDLIAAADRALYRAKGGGRNRVHPLLSRAG